MERTKIEQLFENYSFWRHLSEEEKKMLQKQIRWCTYEEGQMVTDTGRDCLGIFLVCDGILRANLVSEAGKEATVCRIHPGELCVISASCLLPALPFDIQIDAETASEVYLLPTGILRQIMEKNIYLENFIYKKINESFSDIIAAIQKILFASLEQRLVGFLLDEAAGEKDGKIYMTQEQIARAIGSAREAVSRTLKGLVKGGCVELFRGGVCVVDRKELYKKYKKKICAIFCKKVIEQQGREIVSEQGKEEVNLVCYHVYEPGDQILLEAVTAENPPVSDDIPLTGGFFCSDLFISPAVSEYFPYCPRRRW